MTTTTKRYAVVASPGMHGSMEQICAFYTTESLDRAIAAARRYTREYRAKMKRYGGSSGRYRVVECDSRARKGDSLGIAYWVDIRCPTIE